MKVSNWKHWKTSLIGTLIIIAAVVSVFFHGTWKDAIIGIAAGTMFIFAPDTIVDKIKSLITILLIFFTSCMSEKQLAKKCSEKFPIKDSIVIVEHVDTLYNTIKGDSIKVPFYLNEIEYWVDTFCPPIKVPVVTKYKDKIVYQESTAKLFLMQTQLNDSSVLIKTLLKEIIKLNEQKKIDAATIKELKKFKLYTLIFLGLILLLFILALFNKIKPW